MLRFSDLHGVCGGSPIAACFVLRDEKWNWLNIYRAFSNGPIGGVEPPLEPSPLKKSQRFTGIQCFIAVRLKRGANQHGSLPVRGVEAKTNSMKIKCNKSETRQFTSGAMVGTRSSLTNNGQTVRKMKPLYKSVHEWMIAPSP